MQTSQRKRGRYYTLHLSQHNAERFERLIERTSILGVRLPKGSTLDALVGAGLDVYEPKVIS